jgi:hypothetical protein
LRGPCAKALEAAFSQSIRTEAHKELNSANKSSELGNKAFSADPWDECNSDDTLVVASEMPLKRSYHETGLIPNLQKLR